MATFNISYFLATIQKGMTSFTSNNAIGDEILNGIGQMIYYVLDPGDDTTVSYTPDKISRLMSGQAEIHNIFKFKLGEQPVLDLIHSIFSKDIKNDINAGTIETTCFEMLTTIKSESRIPPKRKKELEELFNDENYALFLEKAFIVSLQIPNKVSDDFPIEDSLFISEAQNKCPLCGKQLVTTRRGIQIAHYQISKIYDSDFDDEFLATLKEPSTEDGFDNQIILCSTCAADYKSNPTKEIYEKLINDKKLFKINTELKNELVKFDVPYEMNKIIEELGRLSSSNISILDNLNAVEVKNKILPENGTLRNQILTDVGVYYDKIAERFSQLEADGQINFNKIKLKVHQAYESIALAVSDQNKIHATLIKWLQEQLGYDDDKYILCQIMIDFFVQNCEVFHEIS